MRIDNIPKYVHDLCTNTLLQGMLEDLFCCKNKNARFNDLIILPLKYMMKSSSATRVKQN